MTMTARTRVKLTPTRSINCRWFTFDLDLTLNITIILRIMTCGNKCKTCIKRREKNLHWSVTRVRAKNHHALTVTYNVSQKSSPLKLFCDIFTQVKFFSVKFCQHVASSYLHISADFSRFILIFNKMALIFLGVPIVFNFFSFKFHQVKAP